MAQGRIRPKSGASDTTFWVAAGRVREVRLEQDKVCLLVMIGVRADGTKELIARDDGIRVSAAADKGHDRHLTRPA
jgi:putative transposase